MVRVARGLHDVVPRTPPGALRPCGAGFSVHIRARLILWCSCPWSFCRLEHPHVQGSARSLRRRWLGVGDGFQAGAAL